MTDGFELDISELITEAERLPRLAEEAREKMRPVVAKGALNIKQQQQAEARESRHFKIAPLISYDTHATQSVIEAEIGPRDIGAGELANIAYFGGSKGGGGTLPDPEIALKAEGPNFEKAVADVITEVFGG